MVSRRSVIAGIGAAAAMPAFPVRAAPRVLTAPIALDNGRVLMAVGMNGQGPYIFLIDTGGVVSLVREDLAKRLRLPIIGHSALGGAGGHDIYGVYEAREFIIGNVWRQAGVALVGVPNIDFGPDILGTMAAGLITAADTELDFDANQLRLYPDGRGARTGFTRIPSRIRRLGGPEGSPHVFADATLDRNDFSFLLDTGSPRPAILFARGARRSGLWDDARPHVPTRPSGLGGTGPLGRIVRADRLTLGALTVERPLVLLDPPTSRLNDVADGIIGLPLIKRFNLSIDSHARELWVQPSKLAADPDRYAMSGLWIGQHGDTVVIEAVGSGSPAAEVGLAVGDTLVGDPLTVAIRKINAPAGANVPLVRERGGVRKNVTLVPRPYL